MKNTEKQYWKGTEELTNDPDFVKHSEKEFSEYLPINENRNPGSTNSNGGTSRRDFLKMMGFSISAASLAACEAPIRKAIPYLHKPVDVDPGIPNFYASTYTNGGNYCSIVVKTREGRPIKIEGNKLSKVSGGATSAQVEASVLSLYDTARLRGPQKDGKDTEWNIIDQQIIEQLSSISASGGKIRIVSKSILSPTTRGVMANFALKFPGTEVVMYDPISSYAAVSAHKQNFGVEGLPTYHFDKAKTIVSFACDFLGTWINPIQHSADFGKTRKLGPGKKEMSRLYQFEATLSLTGANADYRTPLRPSAEGLAVAHLYNLIASKRGGSQVQTPKINDEAIAAKLSMAAEDLLKSSGSGIVVSGSNDVHVQMLINGINSLLGNYGQTIDLNKLSYFRQGNDEQMLALIDDLSSGSVDAVIFYNSNPVYDHPMGATLSEAIKKAKLSVSTSDVKDETASFCTIIAPDHHYLESWNDSMPVEGHYSLTQPVISPLFNTRQAQDSFLRWSSADIEYYEFLNTRWKNDLFTNQSEVTDFELFWDKCLHDGVYEETVASSEAASLALETGNIASAISSRYKLDNTGTELVIYQKIGLGDGSQANNPWLQELPDPISKACWDNYVTVSQKWANEQGLRMVESNTYKIELTIGGNTIALPALVQPGQADGTIGLALGYGRTMAGNVGNGVGVNAFPFLRNSGGYLLNFVVEGVSISATKQSYKIAQTQTHHTFMNRSYVIQESVLSEYQKDPMAGRHVPHIAASAALTKKLGGTGSSLKPSAISLWKGHEYANHHWAMAVDLNSCTGCGACVVSCQAENNIPVVGREEVLNRREMHWLRIDRYYSSVETASNNKELEIASDNPEVVFQPMLCQQCNNAPCETVCPVAATTHSSEGLNQMTYNRCIGTRYCANNCPYKVRRFNWFKYHDNNKFDTNSSMNNDLGKMVLNPDVTVRSRGVMEKCTFCVQRIQLGKLEAKKEGRRPDDSDITTACASSCPSEAIVFGDLKNENSRVAKLLRFEDKGDTQEVNEERAYHVLEEINVRPNIWYFTKIRNKEEQNA